ncbi:hypothetical protein, partial [uncultured Dubosiella sp.]|uniref:hypothetical protein n=1 Tax=uncultured Dubosiella sp. TaxID=1937011 RepID=UPI002730C850
MYQKREIYNILYIWFKKILFASLSSISLLSRIYKIIYIYRPIISAPPFLVKLGTLKKEKVYPDALPARIFHKRATVQAVYC